MIECTHSMNHEPKLQHQLADTIPHDDNDNKTMSNKRLERSNSRDFASSKGMIARITMGGMLLINTVMNSHSLHDSIGRYEASIDGGMRMPEHLNHNDDDDNVRRRRRLNNKLHNNINKNTKDNNHNNNNKIIRTDDELQSLDQELLSFLSGSSIGRKKVIELMIDQYVSPTTPDDNMTDKLDNAMEAMSFIETDPNPVQVMGFPFLFVGSVAASLNHKALQDMGITNVINWSSTARCNVFDDIEYMCIKGVRGESSMQKHTDELEKAVEYIESVRLAGGKAMSHCWYGKNRSVTLLVAYLMKYEGMTAAEANDLIKKSRPQADPYWGALQEYSNNYLSSLNQNPSAQSSSSSSSPGLRSRNNSKSATTDNDKKIPNVQWKNEDQS